MFVHPAAIPFNRDSPIMLDVLYSMERDKIPILTELATNKKIRYTICSEHEEAIYKWPTFTKASFHEPTWKKLISILEIVEQNDLMKNVKRYLKKMKGIIIIVYIIIISCTYIMNECKTSHDD